MKILITGGLGHIGSYLLENIDKIKYIKKVYIIDNLLTNRYCSLFNLPKSDKKIYFYQKDLSSVNSLNNFQKVDVIINLAAITDAEGSFKIRNKIYRNNLGIFSNIIKYCRKNSSKLIHISSTSVYGEQKGLVDENCKKLDPKSPYAKIKVKEENILKRNKNKIKFVSYRFGTISGDSKGMRFHTAVNKFCYYAILGKPLPVWKSMINKQRPYLSLKDAFKVIKFTIEKNFFNNETFNILSQNLTLKKIISYLKKNKKAIKIKYVKSKLINQYSYKVSKNKFAKRAILLKSNIHHDIKSTFKKFKNINNEM
jgi:nucleoside-diphosphate-sugar epimerase|tara:strand:+ start:1947 stop:2879 length:933 start_codon:yes stop_codon:yes gene_type:complete